MLANSSPVLDNAEGRRLFNEHILGQNSIYKNKSLLLMHLEQLMRPPQQVMTFEHFVSLGQAAESWEETSSLLWCLFPGEGSLCGTLLPAHSNFSCHSIVDQHNNALLVDTLQMSGGMCLQRIEKGST